MVEKKIPRASSGAGCPACGIMAVAIVQRQGSPWLGHSVPAPFGLKGRAGVNCPATLYHIPTAAWVSCERSQGVVASHVCRLWFRGRQGCVHAMRYPSSWAGAWETSASTNSSRPPSITRCAGWKTCSYCRRLKRALALNFKGDPVAPVWVRRVGVQIPAGSGVCHSASLRSGAPEYPSSSSSFFGRGPPPGVAYPAGHAVFLGTVLTACLVRDGR